MPDERKEYTYIPMIWILPSIIDEFILRILPDEYDDVVKHYINAKIELLKAFREVLNARIKELEELKSRREIKKEKVDLE